MKKVAAELDSMNRSAKSMPPLCRSLIRGLPGNKICVDCNAPNPEWASVTYGCMICMNCSGRHRSYGVRTSFIKSLYMDHWTTEEALKMLEGGNDQLQSFFDRHQMGQGSTIGHDRYHTKAALYYRTQMAKHVTSVVQQGTYQGREASRRRYNPSSQEEEQHQQHQQRDAGSANTSPDKMNNQNGGHCCSHESSSSRVLSRRTVSAQ